MNCPKCDAVVQPAAAECPQCGVVLSKAHGGSTRPRYVPHTAAPAPAARGGQWPIVVLLVAVFAIAYAVRNRRSAGGSSDVSPGWYADAAGYERALTEQAGTKKPVLVYFHTDWCGWCKKLDSDVFMTTDFNSRFGSVIKVKVNAEKGRAERALASDFGVSGYPTVVVVRGGQRGEPIAGYLPPADYMTLLDSMVR